MVAFSDINTTCVAIFGVLALGDIIGKIRSKIFSLGSVGTLIIAILTGFLIQSINTYYYNALKQDFSTFSNVGMYFFISAIGLETGCNILLVKRKYIVAFICGISMVSIGALSTVLLSRLFAVINKDVMMGVFSGAMTSTPALSEALALTETDNASIGYASSYFFGVVLVVLSVSILGTRKGCFVRNSKTAENPKNALLPIFLTVALGIAFGGVSVCGYKAGETLMILLLGMVVGFVYKKTTHHTLDTVFIKHLGLVLFFVGTGFSAGGGLAMHFSPILILIGFFISLVSILSGLALTKSFRLTSTDAMSVICGGMTSSPAYGALNEKNSSVDGGMFTSAYIGALIALIAAIRLMKMIL